MTVVHLPAQAATVPTAGGTYTVAAAGGMCIDVPGAATTSGTLLQQWGCTGGTWQQFKLVSAGSGYNLVNVNSGLCVDVPGASSSTGVQLQQWGCGNAQKNQTWTLAAGGSGTYQLVSASSGLCAAVKGGSTASGAAITQETCAANTSEQWAFDPVSTGSATVAADGTGRYTTVQAAIDAVPANNTSRVVITIKPGTYREIVTVPSNKPYITLQGLGTSPGDVVIVNNHYAGGGYGTSGSATAFINGHDFIATDLTISNDFDESTTTSGGQAVALNLGADRAVLRDVHILGDQDTFLVNDSARAYVVNSYVNGTVDFIFGGGVAVFSGCEIHENPRGGSVTAASTPATSPYGFLFYKSTITGAAANGSTILGRPWRPDAQVVYRESTLSAVVNTAQPWADMSSNSWRNARFFEYRDTGPGATVNANRPQLTDAQAATYTPQKYLAGGDGWNPT
ncbi:pectinesterase family protein [Actinoallomurus sp. CA-150999]|uniref:pectinesterase family protein n=1 Tax=Actinoallomurus sp. CA-150999 TaxID=3239887 RepID=UPI003D8E6CFB